MADIARQNLKNRPDLLIISEIIPEGASVLDLGCGNGNLLQILRKDKKSYACGVEISQAKILECVAKGAPVIHGDLNDGLNEFTDKSFDFVVLSQTIQAVNRPDQLLEDMIRVGNKVIISFLNIGYIKARCQLFFKGRMPVTKQLPDTWYNTPNIHLATIDDFRALCRQHGFRIIREIPFGYKCSLCAKLWPNIFAPTCVFVLEEISKIKK